MSVNFKTTCLKCSLLTVFLLFLQVSYSQKKSAIPNPVPVLDKAIDDQKKQLGNDFSVMIAVGDSVVYQRTTGDAANLKTPSPIGVSSQWLTTALILQLA